MKRKDKRKATSPGQRSLIRSDFKMLTKKRPEKALTLGKRATGGRNNRGVITCRHRGGGHKRALREIDFTRNKLDVPAKVVSIEYDPNRSARIALLHYVDGDKRYIIAPKGIKVGDKVSTTKLPPFNIGVCMKLRDMPLGAIIYNIELHPGRGGKLVRSAGASAQLLARSAGYATVRMPSSETRLIHEECRATFGVVSNESHLLRSLGKAGRTRYKGIRPTVRGTVMNPVDHPHGGGNGKSKGNIPQTPWGKITKGLKTRSKKKTNKHVIKARKKRRR